MVLMLKVYDIISYDTKVEAESRDLKDWTRNQQSNNWMTTEALLDRQFMTIYDAVCAELVLEPNSR